MLKSSINRCYWLYWEEIIAHFGSKGYYVICGVRDKNKFHTMESLRGCMEVIELDLTNKESLNSIPSDIDFAYYLVHSMSTSRNYDVLEKQSAINFRESD